RRVRILDGAAVDEKNPDGSRFFLGQPAGRSGFEDGGHGRGGAEGRTVSGGLFLEGGRGPEGQAYKLPAIRSFPGLRRTSGLGFIAGLLIKDGRRLGRESRRSSRSRRGRLIIAPSDGDGHFLCLGRQQEAQPHRGREKGAACGGWLRRHSIV